MLDLKFKVLRERSTSLAIKYILLFFVWITGLHAARGQVNVQAAHQQPALAIVDKLNGRAQGKYFRDASITDVGMGQGAGMVSSATDFFRTKNSLGDWGTPGDWESSADNNNWETASLAPDEQSAGILIRAGHNMTIGSGTFTADQVVVETGAALVLNAGSLTLNDGAGTDLQVNGTFTQNSGAGAFGMTANSMAAFGSAAVYNHARPQGIIPTATWDVASLCNVTGFTNGAIAGMGQNFGNFTWNCPAQNANYTINEANFGTQGTFTVSGTGSCVRPNCPENFVIYLSLWDGGPTGSTGSFTFGNVVTNGTGVLIFNDQTDNESGTVASYTSYVHILGDLSITANSALVPSSGNAPTVTGSIYKSVTFLGGNLHVTPAATLFVYSFNYSIFLFTKNGTQTINYEPSTLAFPQHQRLSYAVIPGSTVKLLNNLKLFSKISQNGTIDYAEFSISGTLDCGEYLVADEGSSSAFTPTPGVLSNFFLAGNTSLMPIEQKTLSVSSQANSDILTSPGTDPTTFLVPGMAVTGPGIPAGTYILGMSTSRKTITLSKYATETHGSAIMTFSSNGKIITANTNGLNSTGLSGSIQTYGQRRFAASADYTYNGINQNTGSFITSPVNGSVNSLQIASTGEVTNTYGSALNVNGTLSLTGGNFNVANNTLNVNGPAIAGTPSKLVTSSSSSLTFGGSSAGISIPSSVTELNNLTINNANGVSISSSPTISGTLTLTNGSLNIGSNTLTLNGPAISGTPANLVTTPSSSLSFGGNSTGISIPSGVIELNNLAINNANGISLSSSPTISGSLNLTNGSLAIGNNTLTLNGTVAAAGTGNLKGSPASNLVIGGSGSLGTLKFDQTIDGTTNTLQNFTLNRTATGTADLANKLVLTDTYTPIAGVLTTAGFLTLRSTNSKTARVAESAITDYISGNVTVERFIGTLSAKRAYRLLTAPLRGGANNSIFDTWQNGGNNTAANGTWITAPVTPTSENGIDGNSGFTLQQFNLPEATLSGVSNTKSALLFGNTTGIDAGNNSYFLFVRGDRTIAQSTVSGPTTLKATGFLQTGDQRFPLNASAQGLSLIGNPYASPVSFNLLATDNPAIKRHYYFWDPNKQVASGVGGYISYGDNGVGGFDFDQSAPSGAAPYSADIQSGQAVFMVTNNAGPGQFVTFKESHKSDVLRNTVFRSGTQSEKLAIALGVADGSTATNLDGTLARYNNIYTAGVGAYDVNKLTSPGENIFLFRDGVNLAIESRPLADDNDTLFIRTNNLGNKTYQLTFSPENFDAPQLQAWLQDLYLDSEIPVSLYEPTSVRFTTNSDAASKASGRFRLVFKQVIILPLSFAGIKAYEKGNGIQVEWKMGDEQNIKHYEIEKSTDGRIFNKQGIQAAANRQSSDQYSWLDGIPNDGGNYYRIKAVDKNGGQKYSQVVIVKINKNNSAITAYPNPVKGGLLNIQFINQPKGKYAIQLFNNLGQQVHTSQFNHIGGSATESIELKNAVGRGIYQLKVSDGTRVEHRKILVE